MSKEFNCAMQNSVELNDRVWFWAFRENCLCSASKDFASVRTELLELDDYHTRSAFGEYGKVLRYRNKIVIIPESRANDVLLFDVDRKKTDHIAYPLHGYIGGRAFEDGLIHGNELILFPSQYDSILIIDLETYNVETVNIGCTEFDPWGYSWGSICVVGDSIYFTALCNNSVFRFDLRNRTLSSFKCSLMERGAGIVGAGNALWIIPQKADKIIKCNTDGEVLNVFEKFPYGYEEGDWSFSREIYINGYIYLLPRDANMALVFDPEQLSVKPVDFFCDTDRDSSVLTRYMPVSNIWERENELFYCSSDDGDIYGSNSGRIPSDLEFTEPVLDGDIELAFECPRINLNTFINYI